MNDREIFKKVGVIISELSGQYNYLAETPGSLNEFELELLRANGKFLTDHIEILQRLVLSTKVQPATPPPAAEEPAKEEQQEPETETAEPGQPGHDPMNQEQPVRAEGDGAPAAEPEVAGTEPVVTEVVISEKTVAIDLPAPAKPGGERVPTVHDQIASSMDNNKSTVAGSLGRQPVGDLKSAISLNDKLLFVKELFGGYSLAYNEAIELANRCAGFEAAKNFLEVNYAGKNNWESRPVATTKLFELLKRRFEG